MRKLKVLELFSGTRSVSKAFEAHGHETFCVEWDRQFEADLYMDIGKLKAEKVLKLFGRPDVIWVIYPTAEAGGIRRNVTPD